MQKPKRRKKTKSSRRGLPLFDNPSPLIDRAANLQKLAQDEAAIKAYDEAILHEPENVRAYVCAARANADLFRFSRMEAIHESLVRRAPRHPGVHHFIGETYKMIQMPQLAIRSFETAASLPGVLPGTWMELASLYEKSHRLDEATDLMDRCKKAGLNLPAFQIIRARV
jgi:tetratricopeptide (TPR) repeat protein